VSFHLDVLPAIPNPDGGPSAILLTDRTLLRWQHSDPIAYGRWFKIAAAMPEHIGHEDGRWVIANPVEPRENFADKWSERPGLADAFFGWLDRLQEDLKSAQEKRGLDQVVAHLSESFGERPIEKAAAGLGDAYLGARERGQLGFAATTGSLSAGGSIPVRRHDFYGERRHAH
jgi:hypothetical protein